MEIVRFETDMHLSCRAAVKHMADLLGTTKHIGIGSDMDGGLGREEIPKELTTAADLPRLGDALSQSGFNDRDVLGVMCQNWLDFFRRSLPHASSSAGHSER